MGSVSGRSEIEDGRFGGGCLVRKKFEKKLKKVRNGHNVQIVGRKGSSKKV
jgi:hypothetical protein